MGSGAERRGNPRRQTLGKRHVLRAVRSPGVSVAEAQRAQHFTVADDRDDERGRRRQSLLQSGACTAIDAIIVTIDLPAKRRLAGADDRRDGARQVVAPDPGRRSERAHVTGERRAAVHRRDAAERARLCDVDEAEIGEAGERSSHRAIDGTFWHRQRGGSRRRCGS